MNDDLATALEAASNNASALVQILTEDGTDEQVVDADRAQRRLLFAATEANAVNAIKKLGTTTQNQQNLTKLSAQMDTVTQRLSQDEANLAKFVSLGADALNLSTALSSTPINVSGGMSAVVGMLSTLGVAL